jgi:23S rRNA pseudouridine2605 synthase
MSNFKKFINTGDSGAKKKERIRQEKKKIRQETKEYFEKKKQEAREARAHGAGYKPQTEQGNKTEGTRQRGSNATGQRGYEGKGNRQPATGNRQKNNEAQPARFKAGGTFKPQTEQGTKFKGSKATTQPGNEGKGNRQKNNEAQPARFKVEGASKSQTTAKPETQNHKQETGAMPLNKFIAHAGICSRRDAADMVKAGKVVVNGEKILEPGHKVTDKDDIKVNGKKLHIRRNLVYILLNKPKDFITTTEDPQGRKTVLDIIRNATPERVYPIGRLDRNTTGVLLLTNDGELAQKLSHPSYEVKKIYEVKLDKPLVKKDFDAILNGVTLEDGFIAPDTLAYADPKDKSVIGIEIHSGRNRIVRRIFEHMGYDVRNLDRVMYANLTKKNVDRGKWRFLTEKEIRLLKYLNASYTKNK